QALLRASRSRTDASTRCERAKCDSRFRELQRRASRVFRCRPRKGCEKEDQRKHDQAASDDCVRHHRRPLRGEPCVQGDEADGGSANKGEGADTGQDRDPNHIADTSARFFFGPVHLPINVGLDQAEQRREQQPRPRDIIPITTPTRTAPAIVPRGLRRAIPSSSAANVFACSVAEDMRSAPASVAPPTCAATFWPTPRIDFAASPPAWAAKRATWSFRLANSRRNSARPSWLAALEASTDDGDVEAFALMSLPRWYGSLLSEVTPSWYALLAVGNMMVLPENEPGKTPRRLCD